MLAEIYSGNYWENISLKPLEILIFNCFWLTKWPFYMTHSKIPESEWWWWLSWILMRREEITRWRCVHQSQLNQETKTLQWTAQEKLNLKNQDIWLRRDWLERSKGNYKEYRKSRCKGQSLPNPSTEMEYSRKNSFSPPPRSEIWKVEWQKSCCNNESPENSPSGMQGEIC